MCRVLAAKKPAASKAAATSLSAAVAPAAAKRRPRAKAVEDADDEEVMSPAVVPKVWQCPLVAPAGSPSPCRGSYCKGQRSGSTWIACNTQECSSVPIYAVTDSRKPLDIFTDINLTATCTAGQGTAHEGVALQQGLWFGQAAARQVAHGACPCLS